MKKIIFISCSFLIGVIISGCTPMPSIEELMNEEIESRIDKLKNKKRKACREYIMDEAENLVDSIMYMEIGSSLKNAGEIPMKPERPIDSLAYSVELDTGDINSMLPDSLHKDTISSAPEGRTIK